MPRFTSLPCATTQRKRLARSEARSPLGETPETAHDLTDEVVTPPMANAIVRPPRIHFPFAIHCLVSRFAFYISHFPFSVCHSRDSRFSFCFLFSSLPFAVTCVSHFSFLVLLYVFCSSSSFLFIASIAVLRQYKRTGKS